MADDAQPEEGQGEGGAGLYDSYLQFVPEDRREDALAALKESSSTVDARLREAADIRKTYEPYAQAGYGPEEISQLVGWHQEVTSDPEKYREFLKAESEAAGVIPAAERTPEQDVLAELSPAQITELVQQQLAPIEERINSDQEQRLVQEEVRLITGTLETLAAQHGVELDEEDREDILGMGERLQPDAGRMLVHGEDWVTPGFDRWLKGRSKAQKVFVDGKAKQPAPAVSAGGVAATQASTSWADVREQARERMRQTRT